MLNKIKKIIEYYKKSNFFVVNVPLFNLRISLLRLFIAGFVFYSLLFIIIPSHKSLAIKNIIISVPKTYKNKQLYIDYISFLSKKMEYKVSFIEIEESEIYSNLINMQSLMVIKKIENYIIDIDLDFSYAILDINENETIALIAQDQYDGIIKIFDAANNYISNHKFFSY